MRVLLLMPTTSYKAEDFLAAAERLAVEVVVGSDSRQALEAVAPGHTLAVDLRRPERGVERILELHERRPLDAVVGVDDEATELAALVAQTLNLRHNPPAAVRAARDKHVMRQRLATAGVRGPRYGLVTLNEDPHRAARDQGYPCVLKPLRLSAGRGVIRADDADTFVAAFERIRAILGGADVRRAQGEATHLLVESYLPGREVALEGLLDRGRLRVLALFDKPDPLEGPVFEETIYVTPSRLPREVQRRIADEAARGCRALDLREGPVHAELRIDRTQPTIVEVAARTIGGLCSRALRFGAGVGLEELVLRHALGLDTTGLALERRAAGVMMLPIPGAGVLRRVRGLNAARAVAGIEQVSLTAHRGERLVPLPEGHRYLGFVFARADEPAQVERALRSAHARIEFEIDGHPGGNGGLTRG